MWFLKSPWQVPIQKWAMWGGGHSINGPQCSSDTPPPQIKKQKTLKGPENSSHKDMCCLTCSLIIQAKDIDMSSIGFWNIHDSGFLICSHNFEFAGIIEFKSVSFWQYQHWISWNYCCNWCWKKQKTYQKSTGRNFFSTIKKNSNSLQTTLEIICTLLLINCFNFEIL